MYRTMSWWCWCRDIFTTYGFIHTRVYIPTQKQQKNLTLSMRHTLDTKVYIFVLFICLSINQDFCLNLCQISWLCPQCITIFNSFILMGGSLFLRYEALVRGNMEYAVEYRKLIYIFETKQKQDTFLRWVFLCVSFLVLTQVFFSHWIFSCAKHCCLKYASNCITLHKDNVIFLGINKYWSATTSVTTKPQWLDNDYMLSTKASWNLLGPEAAQ